MESDKSGLPEEAVMEKDEPIVETPDASETPLVAAVESAEQPPVNSPTEEQSAATPEGKQDMDSPAEEKPELVSDPVQASTPCLQNPEEQPLPQNDLEPSEVPQINGPTETEPERSAEPQLEPPPAQSALVEPPNPEEKASEVVEAATVGVVSTEVEAANLEPKEVQKELEEVKIPLFYGWFLMSPANEKVKCSAIDFVKTLDTLEAFKKHSADFTGKAEKEVDLEQHFKAKASLHCTTKFSNYGKAEGAKEYAQNLVVKDHFGSVSELSLIAFFVTPRTVGARVSLTKEQLQLWPVDAESSVPGATGLPHGSRAHVTLACAAGVEAVQTGLDLLDILALQKDGQQGELVEMELGSLSYYGEGRWMLALREPICASACFSSSYKCKQPELAKPEKKKKPKCTIL
uniref:Cyclic nucleotide phosphodiesterase catalytic domain-containing protein n=1 Tax=Gouania willdenowi TaxID=441366 RepID=A0A8C5D822_GOUWI